MCRRAGGGRCLNARPNLASFREFHVCNCLSRVRNSEHGLALMPVRTDRMIHHSGGKNSDVAWPLRCVGVRWTRFALAWNAISGRRTGSANGALDDDSDQSFSTASARRIPCSYGDAWLCFLVVGLAIGNFASIGSVHAQSPRQSGLSQPEPSSELPTSKRSSDSTSNRQDRAAIKPPANSRSSNIRQVSQFEHDDEQPVSPFHLDEPLADVVIEGNSTIPNPEIAKNIKTRPG